MGKAARWLKSILGLKRVKERESSDASCSAASERREKKRWSFAKTGRDSNADIPLKQAVWLKSYLNEIERSQNNHAIAVATATTAAADAAVAAAQAAIAVVKLTSQGRGGGLQLTKEWLAAVKIQTLFRGYLARKALRALRALVKLQALVRGYLVRKRAAATLQSMLALIRTQSHIRAQRAVLSFNKENRYHQRPRKSLDDFNSKRVSLSSEAAPFSENPKIVEMDTCKPLCRSGEDVPSPVRSQIFTTRQDFDWYVGGEDCRFSTAQNTPRYSGTRTNAAAKSVCGESYPYFPNYMCGTQSSKAKLRSLSAPKQRPEPITRKRLSLNTVTASRNSISTFYFDQN